ncbi:hypothetical protein QN277_020496 [Acacia crassicarpa]|uniref:Uncharacterized protein n=1 Tax=Acacia crassicarpa TaxID=499986 RepID=A0AAE1ML35_9FABA|nr:hypothetical protein QN277_020496 [Acacia crassicarpa]
MVTEMQELRRLRTRRNSSSWSCSCSWKEFEANESIHKYTSLKEILDVSWPRSFCFCFDVNNELDPSNVAIKNVLVRRAASAYLQSSSALLVPRNHPRLLISAVVNPLKDCLSPFLRFIHCLLTDLRSLTRT